jgi:hypothetical protein
LALKQFYIKNVGPAKIQRVQQKIPGCWTYAMSSKMKTNFKKSDISYETTFEIALKYYFEKMWFHMKYQTF